MTRLPSIFDHTYIQPTQQLEPGELEKLRVSFQEQVQVWQPDTGVLETQNLRDTSSNVRLTRDNFKKELTCLMVLFLVLFIALVGLVMLTFQEEQDGRGKHKNLVSADHDYADNDFESNGLDKHYETDTSKPFSESACASFPCLNGGICENVRKTGFVCLCVGEWYGRICDAQVNFDNIDWSSYGIRIDDEEMLGEIDMEY